MAQAATRHGIDAFLYRNTGSYGTPVWNQVEHKRDVGLNLGGNETDLSDAASAFEQAGISHISLEFSAQLRYSVGATPNDDWIAFKAAAFATGASREMELALMDGDITVSGEKGVRSWCVITGFNESQPYKGVITADVTFKPAPSADAEPAEYTVP
jgi:hypothetical protein